MFQLSQAFRSFSIVFTFCLSQTNCLSNVFHRKKLSATQVGNYKVLSISASPYFETKTAHTSTIRYTTLFSSLHDTDDVRTDRLPQNIVEELDLKFILQFISKYAVTKRGRDAFLHLVGMQEETPSSRYRPTTVSKWKGILSSVRSHSLNSAQEARDDNNSNDTFLGSSTTVSTKNKSANPSDYSSRIITIAETVEEARNEYDLIQEALHVLDHHKVKDVSTIDIVQVYRNITPSIRLPPFYGSASFPWDSSTQETKSDEDEWLDHIVRYGITDELRLENLLQAEQVIKRALETYQWALEYSHDLPLISEIGCKIQSVGLEKLYQELSGVVIIVQENTYNADIGIKRYSFQIDPSKFDTLTYLRDREKKIKLQLKLSDDHVLEKAYKKKVSEQYKELIAIQEDIKAKEIHITNRLWTLIAQNSQSINHALSVVARLDTVFARAVYGISMGGVIPHIGLDGIIQIEDFIHPVLAQIEEGNRSMPSRSANPINLQLPYRNGRRALVITGPNGGGKTVGLKSFGIAAVLSKLGIPLLTKRKKNPQQVRVDFFDDVFTQVGDQQSVVEGFSTLTARLSNYARIVNRLSSESYVSRNRTSLVLLDELGSGTDQQSGGALAQAILEDLLDQESVRIVATTHLPRLKTLSLVDNRFDCATVDLNPQSLSKSLILQNIESKDDISGTSFMLRYGSIGYSSAIDSALHCDPRLPQKVLERAKKLSTEDANEDQELFAALTLSVRREKEALSLQLLDAENLRKEMFRCRDAVISLANSHESKLKRIELRLSSIYQSMKDASTDSLYQVVGNSIADVRIIRKHTEDTISSLRGRGLRPLPNNYRFCPGDTVVIVEFGPWEGMMGTISINQDVPSKKHVNVEVLLQFEGDGKHINNTSYSMLTIEKDGLALWAYPEDESLQGDEEENRRFQDAEKSRSNLLHILSTLQKPKKVGEVTSPDVKVASYRSSRERKAAVRKNKKK